MHYTPNLRKILDDFKKIVKCFAYVKRYRQIIVGSQLQHFFKQPNLRLAVVTVVMIIQSNFTNSYWADD